MRTRMAPIVATIAMLTALAGAGVGSAQATVRAPAIGNERAVARLSRMARLEHARGYLPLHPAALARVKAVANARAGVVSRSSWRLAHLAGPNAAPIVGTSWEGQYENDVAPADAAGAVGPTRYLELINDRYGIYDRSGGVLASGSLGDLSTGHSAVNLTNPQTFWDHATNRFYYLSLDASNSTFAWGFSKSDSPSSATDFCQYTADFGYGSSTSLPDFPRLGDSKDFLVVGVNVFKNFVSYVGSDLDWIGKPVGAAAVTTCPDPSTFVQGQKQALKNVDGSLMSTPVPAVQVDAGRTGWIIGAPDVTLTGGGSTITLFKVHKSSTGSAIITPAGQVAVASYSVPAAAPECQTPDLLDTLDGRFTHAVLAKDTRKGRLALWAAHTVMGGAGAEVRWYEINPKGESLLQKGAATSATLDAFDGTIAPDRAVGSGGSSYGANMVMGFNTSSASACPAVQMVSKVGANAQSAFALVKHASGPNVDYTCGGGVCRWGNYSSASSDPGAAIGQPSGQVWLSAPWNVASTDDSGLDWRTWNWAATP